MYSDSIYFSLVAVFKEGMGEFPILDLSRFPYSRNNMYIVF